MNGPQKHASLTTLAFRPVVESLDLTPREAGAIPPVSPDVASLSARTQWFVGVSVVLHCVGLVALFGLSRPDSLPPIQEVAFEIVVETVASRPAPAPAPVVAAAEPAPAPAVAAPEPAPLAADTASLADAAPAPAGDDTDAGGVTIVGQAPPASAPAPARTPDKDATSGPKLAAADTTASTDAPIRLDMPTYGLSSALRARPASAPGPAGRLAFASAGHIVLQPIAEIGPVDPAPEEADETAALSADPAPAPTPPPAPVDPADSTAGLSSPLRLAGQEADVTGTLPPAAPDVSNTVLAVASGQSGATGAPPLAMFDAAPPELVPFPPGAGEEAAAREAAARRADMARLAETQRACKAAEQKALAEARAKAAREAARQAKATAQSSRDWRIKVARHIHDYQSYPEAVRQRGFEGTVRLAFTVDGSGKVVSKQVTKSSGDKELDQEALAAVQRASPFPPPPPKASRTFSAPFVYKLK